MNPCGCKFEFRNQFVTILCKIVDVILIFLSGVFLVGSSATFHDHPEGHPELDWDEIYRRRDSSLNVAYIVLSVSLVHLILTSFSYCWNNKIGASVWFIVGLTICLIAWLIGTVTCIVYNFLGYNETPYVIVSIIIVVLLYAYQVYVCYCFRNEVKNKSQVNNSQIKSNVMNV